ncbi:MULTISPECIES: hypothetical protein [Burkholderia]|uniref:hypothetical protein n=1 Tax=Burkholderia TaxID=32008 RepID=UPI0011777CB0|nr:MULTISPECIES: hypothetical protein [Burkholderia]MDN7491520.1 hypothetical protein [Burkholderia sp. AU45274]
MSSTPANSVTMNGVHNKAIWQGGYGYLMYTGGLASNQTPEWNKRGAFVADVEVVINNSVVSDWPALSIRAGNYTDDTHVVEATGGAYLGRFGTASNCTVVDPETPPSPPIVLKMNAPDWNLGELPEGDSEKMLSGADQLCFTYDGPVVSGKKFVIDATSVNGVVGNRYRLRNVSDATQFIPYDVTLNSGSSTTHLPNTNNTALSLNSSGKTCFAPTFKTTVGRELKEGDYNDVLVFTVVTKA